VADAGDVRAEFYPVIQSEQVDERLGRLDQVENREMGWKSELKPRDQGKIREG
jgi:hypothetical protein